MSGFLFLFWSETKLSIVNGPSTFIGFIDRVGCKRLRGFVFKVCVCVCCGVGVGLVLV